MRIGFLFNHDQVHQVAHGMPIAAELSRRGGAEIVVATTSERLAEEARRLAGDAVPLLRFVDLRLRRPSSRALAATLETVVPATKVLVLRDNLDFFRRLDLLVVTEKTSLLLKRRFGLDGLRIVHTRHGAGDRAIGFDRQSAGFDHVLVSGAKIRDRLVSGAGIDPARITVVGYPKFDVCPEGARADHDPRPLVLYNPHPSPHLSSWYAEGAAILRWFARQDRYRLLFAPHVMLFERKFVVSLDRLRVARPGRIEPEVERAPNIEIDLGSRASTTMAHTERADVYLGDASSQVYEFLRRPRPCVFVNAAGRRWHGDPNYAHWSAGPVVTGAAALDDALADSIAEHDARYRSIQERLFAYSFDLDRERSSVRAARAIAGIAGLG